MKSSILGKHPPEVAGVAAILAAYVALSAAQAKAWALMVLEERAAAVPQAGALGGTYHPAEVEEAAKRFAREGYSGRPDGRFARYLDHLREVRRAAVQRAIDAQADLQRPALAAVAGVHPDDAKRAKAQAQRIIQELTAKLGARE